jgi:hypothetical protein
MLVGAFGMTSHDAPAACAAPEITFAKRRVDLGETLTIRGRFWLDECQDSGGCSVNACGQTKCDYGPEPQPYENVRLFLSGPRSVHVGTVDADRRGRFKLRVTIPDVPPGRYVFKGGTTRGQWLGESYETIEVARG